MCVCVYVLSSISVIQPLSPTKHTHVSGVQFSSHACRERGEREREGKETERGEKERGKRQKEEREKRERKRGERDRKRKREALSTE